MIKNLLLPQDEYRQSFLRHLINRLDAVEQRIQRFRIEGWELGAMSLLHDDVQRMAGSAGRYDLMVPSQRLLVAEQMLGEWLAWKRLPGPEQAGKLLVQIGSVRTALAELPDYQRLLGGTETPVATTAAPAADAPQSPPSSDAAAPESASAAIAARRVCLLGDGTVFVVEIAHRLTSEGFEVRTFARSEELLESLRTVVPAMILVDSSRIAELSSVGAARRAALERAPDKHSRVCLVALAGRDDVQTRLEFRRAGGDLLLFPPFNTADLVQELHRQLAPPTEEAMRVLIVEDDRAQALFAQSVLANSGVQVQVELEALRVLEALQSFQPDLVLMDMHMPGANGVELTALIREHQAFMDTPILFLSGDNDPDVRVDAMSAGGDEFLTKPIRPKELIAAVQSRVGRKRAIARRDRMLSMRDEQTGLYRRSWLLDRINDAIGATSDRHSQVGGVLFLEIEGAAALRERLGLVATEQLLAEAGRLLVQEVGSRHAAALINDNAFMILASELDDAGLESLARQLRKQFGKHYFEADGKPARLVPAIGICPLRYGFDDASALINTAERTCRQSFGGEQGIRIYAPPSSEDGAPDAALAQQIRDAIAGDGFELVYQPIAAMQGCDEAQYQTLLRLRDANGRLVPAAEILPLAERAGLMIEIDRWVLSRAMSVLAAQGDPRRKVRLFVPQALTTFAAKEQDVFLKIELATNQLSGDCLVLECRLADALLNPPALGAFANAMHADGIRLCLGQYEHTEEASRLLEQIPLGYIKLAPKYGEQGVPKPLRDELRTLSTRAHQLGIQVIGHRVEDMQTAMTMRMYGVDLIQGNFVFAPSDKLSFDFDAPLV